MIPFNQINWVALIFVIIFIVITIIIVIKTFEQFRKVFSSKELESINDLLKKQKDEIQEPKPNKLIEPRISDIDDLRYMPGGKTNSDQDRALNNAKGDAFETFLIKLFNSIDINTMACSGKSILENGEIEYVSQDSNDGGVDIYIKDYNHRIQEWVEELQSDGTIIKKKSKTRPRIIIIQAKNYNRDMLDPKSVKEIIAAKSQFKADILAVFTTGSAFNRTAITTAYHEKVLLFNNENLKTFVNKFNKGEAWQYFNDQIDQQLNHQSLLTDRIIRK